MLGNFRLNVLACIISTLIPRIQYQACDQPTIKEVESWEEEGGKESVEGQKMGSEGSGE